MHKRKPIIGMRIIKTVIAVGLSAALMQYVFDLNPFFACIGAVVAMDYSISKSLSSAFIRNLGTVTGGVVGILVASFTESILLYSLGVVPLIVLNNKLKRKESIIPGMMVYFAVAYLNTKDQAWVYGLRRIVGTLIGTLVGLLVNILIFPPKNLPQQTGTAAQIDTSQG